MRLLRIEFGTQPASNDLAADKRFELFKFYEDAAERAKSHAWTQSTWILALNGAILGFSLNLYVKDGNVHGFLFIECISTLAGLILCGYVVFVLYELGKHIRNYWTAANKHAVQDTSLTDYIGVKEAAAARHECYRADFPRFIVRLMVPPVLFALAHLTWMIYVTVVSSSLSVAICTR